GHTIRVGSVPGVHGVVPEPADAAFESGLEEWSLVKRFSAVRVRDRLRMTGNDGGMCKADAAVSQGSDRFWQVRELIANVKEIGSRTRGLVALVPDPVLGRDRSPIHARLGLVELGCVLRHFEARQIADAAKRYQGVPMLLRHHAGFVHAVDQLEKVDDFGQDGVPALSRQESQAVLNRHGSHKQWSRLPGVSRSQPSLQLYEH